MILRIVRTLFSFFKKYLFERTYKENIKEISFSTNNKNLLVTTFPQLFVLITLLKLKIIDY